MLEPWQSDLNHLTWLSDVGIEGFKGDRLLDLGCGSGYLCELAMAEGAHSAVGVDLVKPNGFDEEQAKWKFANLDLNSNRWHEDLPQKFSLILAFDILEHLDSPYDFLKSCQELLDADGQLMLTTPNVSSWERYAKPGGWSGVRDPQHKYLFNKYSLGFLLRKVGLTPGIVKAPIRKLSFLGPLMPSLGGQLVCLSKKYSDQG